MLAATDPANPYGALLRWPEEGSALTRSVGARVLLVDGALTAYLRRGNPNIQVMLPEEEPARSQVARALAEFLVRQVQSEENPAGRGRNHADCDGEWREGEEHPLAKYSAGCGISGGADGIQCAAESAAAAGTTSGDAARMPEGDTIFRAARRSESARGQDRHRHSRRDWRSSQA